VPRVQRRNGQDSLYLHLRAADSPAGSGRLNVHLVLVSSKAPITARSWRQLPIDVIEAHANAIPNIRTVLTAEPKEPVPDLDGLDGFFEGEPRSVLALGRARAFDGGEVEPAVLRPPSGSLSDDFLRHLAEVYRWQVAAGQPPALVIAAQTGAPAGTARRWIAEARRRGFLPPGRRGKAG
jgi:hypothetical protein